MLAKIISTKKKKFYIIKITRSTIIQLSPNQIISNKSHKFNSHSINYLIKS